MLLVFNDWLGIGSDLNHRSPVIMAEFKINRPKAKLVHNEAGTRHTYEITSSTMSMLYTRARWVESKAEAQALAKGFLTRFNKAAKRIEESGVRKNIMDNLVKNGQFTQREKVIDEFAGDDKF